MLAYLAISAGSVFFGMLYVMFQANIAKIGTIPVDIYTGRAEGSGQKCQNF
jgi:hypothetical protein